MRERTKDTEDKLAKLRKVPMPSPDIEQRISTYPLGYRPNWVIGPDVAGSKQQAASRNLWRSSWTRSVFVRGEARAPGQEYI